MALGVYVGPLARYYAGDWQSSSELGTKGARAASGRPISHRQDSDLIRSSVIEWRKKLTPALGLQAHDALNWSESTEESWFSGRPGWDGFGSLVLWAAHAEHLGLRRPEMLPEDWDDDPALARSNADGFRSRYAQLVQKVELWLPGAFDATFESADMHGRHIVIGSAVALARQLRELNAATWKMDAGEMAALVRPRPAGDSLDSCARRGLAVMSELAQHAVEHRLPMKMDY